MSAPFWESLQLTQMSDEQWESLCDRCGKCCLHKLQDEDTDEVWYTGVACRLWDAPSGACADYAHRQQQVAECLVIPRDGSAVYDWLPRSCAYRRLAEGRGLAPWHPLRSGSYNSVAKAGHSIAGRCTGETDLGRDVTEDDIIHWVTL